MSLDILEIESLLIQESNLHLNVFDTVENQDNHPQFQALKSTFLSKLQEAEFLKLISGFNPTFHTARQVQELTRQVEQAKSQTKEFRETIREKERDCLLLGQQIIDSAKELENEKQELIRVIGEAREAELSYNNVMNQVHPDQEIVETLLSKEDQEKNQVNDLEKMLQEKTAELHKRKVKIELEQNRVEQLKVRKEDAEKREEEAIRLSKTKDPQMEELGKWYKETIGLLHALVDIEKMIVHSDTRIEIVYSGIPTVNATFELSRDYVDVQLNVNLNIKDVMERQGSFVTMNSKLAFVVTNIRLRVQAYQARIEEMQKFVDQGALYDEQVGELLVQVESKRAFVFRIDPCYPFGGLESIKVVGVEPDYGGEVEKWNSKLKSMNGRLSDAITLFE